MRIFYIIILTFLFGTASSQFHHKKGPIMEVMGGVGVTHVISDIGDFSMGPAITAGYRFRIKKHLSLRASLHSAIFMGNDLGTENEIRGLDFMTVTVEPSVQFEYTFFEVKKSSNRHGKMTMKPKVRPYLFAGGGGVYSMTQIDGDDMSEVTDDYSKFGIAIVGGAGFYHNFQPHFLWGVELGGRYLMTDYLDGFSPSSSTSNDMYNFVTINLVYRWRYSALRK